jgi:hypothetical protein
VNTDYYENSEGYSIALNAQTKTNMVFAGGLLDIPGSEFVLLQGF